MIYVELPESCKEQGQRPARKFSHSLRKLLLKNDTPGWKRYAVLIIPSFEPTLRIIINTPQVRAMWRALDGFHDKSSHQREVVNSVLHGQADEHTIDGKDIVFQVQCMYSVCDQGNALSQKWKKSLQQLPHCSDLLSQHSYYRHAHNKKYNKIFYKFVVAWVKFMESVLLPWVLSLSLASIVHVPPLAMTVSLAVSEFC